MPGAERGKDHNQWQDDCADPVDVGNGVESEPSLQARRVVAEPHCHPGVGEFMQRYKGDKRQKIDQRPSQYSLVHFIAW